MMNILERLYELQDLKYAEFQSNLTPTLDRASVIGVKVPQIRQLAKEIRKEGSAEAFLQALPHTYLEENILHGALLCGEKDFDTAMEKMETFLPYIDNWAVCDMTSPLAFKKNKEKLMGKICKWAASDHTYTIRFAICMLMKHFLDEDFKEEYLQIAADVSSDEYYVKMVQAWYFATALAKQWDQTILLLEEQRLPVWVHNKTIQKARESFRITPQQKEYLKTLKR